MHACLGSISSAYLVMLSITISLTLFAVLTCFFYKTMCYLYTLSVVLTHSVLFWHTKLRLILNTLDLFTNLTHEHMHAMQTETALIVAQSSCQYNIYLMQFDTTLC